MERANCSARFSQNPGRSKSSSRAKKEPSASTEEKRSIRYTRKVPSARAQRYQTPAFSTRPYGSNSRSTSAS